MAGGTDATLQFIQYGLRMLTQLGEQTMAAMARDREQLATDLMAGMDDDRLTRLDDDLAGIAGRLQRMIDAAGPARS